MNYQVRFRKTVVDKAERAARLRQAFDIFEVKNGPTRQSLDSLRVGALSKSPSHIREALKYDSTSSVNLSQPPRCQQFWSTLQSSPFDAAIFSQLDQEGGDG